MCIVVSASLDKVNTLCDQHDLCLATVIIGFQRPHYKVNEGDGCVEVCAVVLAGQFKPSDSISLEIRMGTLEFSKFVERHDTMVIKCTSWTNTLA